MNINDYDKKIELAFYGQGGYYVKENYVESLSSDRQLIDIVKDVKNDIRLEKEEEGEDVSVFDKIDLPRDEQECLSWLEFYLGDKKISYPELCGSIAGVLFRSGERENVLRFLEVLDLNEPIYWDS